MNTYRFVVVRFTKRDRALWAKLLRDSGGLEETATHIENRNNTLPFIGITTVYRDDAATIRKIYSGHPRIAAFALASTPFLRPSQVAALADIVIDGSDPEAACCALTNYKGKIGNDRLNRLATVICEIGDRRWIEAAQRMCPYRMPIKLLTMQSN